MNRVSAPRGVLLGPFWTMAEPEEVDARMKSLGLPMGPFVLMDYMGIDMAYHAFLYRAEALHADYAPSRAVTEKVRAGGLGKKTGGAFTTGRKGGRRSTRRRRRTRSMPSTF